MFPLQLAIRKIDDEQLLIQLVDILIANGADVNSDDGDKELKWTPLMDAANKGFAEVVGRLLNAGADVNFVDDYERNPLNISCNRDFPEVSKILIEAGADVNNIELNGYSPLIRSISNEDKKIVKLLLDSGAKANDPDNDDSDNDVFKYDFSPLVWAAIEVANVEISKILIDHGAKVDICIDEGQTPLMSACQNGDSEIVELLIKSGANINLKDEKGKTPLMHACYDEGEGLVKILLEAGADVNIKDNNGKTALDWIHKCMKKSEYDEYISIDGCNKIIQMLKENMKAQRPK